MEKLNCSVYEISDSIENLVADGATVPLYVSGSSMNPFLVSRRDIVYLRKCAESDVRKGKIILINRKDGVLVLHRIKKVNSNRTLTLNGDAQKWCEIVERRQIVAVVCEIERKGKRRSADSFYWKLLNCFWRFLTPIRSPLMRVWFKIKRIRNNK